MGRSGGQTVDTRSTSGVPLKSLGYNGSNELCGRSVASKLSLQQADGFFYQGDMKIREKGKFFVNRSVPEHFQWEIFLGQVPTESLSTQDSQYLYERGVETFFDSVVPPRSWKMPVRRQLPAKLGRCCKKLGGHNFNFRAKL